MYQLGQLEHRSHLTIVQLPLPSRLARIWPLLYATFQKCNRTYDCGDRFSLSFNRNPLSLCQDLFTALYAKL